MRIDVSLEHRPVETELAALHARMHRPGDVLHALPAFVSTHPGFVFRYREADGEFHVYVEDAARHVLAGCTRFGLALDVDRRARRFLRSPHSRYAAAYRRLGLATAVYRWALDAGLCLVTGPRQSAGAAGLWMALARSYELVFVEGGSERLRILGSKPGPCDLQAFETRMMLLGAGWTLAGFADATGAHLPEASRARQGTLS